MSLDRVRAGGWRARIGVIVPPSNTVNETEFNRLKPDGVTFHFTRSPLHADPAADDFAEMMRDLDRACGDLAACAVDLVAYGCTSGSMACPADRLLGKLREASGAEAVSTADAIVAALNALGVARIAMATPYTDATNAHEAEFLERHGIEVVAASGLGLNASFERHPADLARGPKRGVRSRDGGRPSKGASAADLLHRLQHRRCRSIRLRRRSASRSSPATRRPSGLSLRTARHRRPDRRLRAAA